MSGLPEDTASLAQKV